MKIMYFAWVRDKMGVDEEEILLPAGIQTAGEFIDWFKRRPNL